MRKKMIIYALMGLLIIVGISIYFYFNIRKAFKQRKLV
jgi:hypothetical protein